MAKEMRIENLPKGFAPVSGTTQRMLHLVCAAAQRDYYMRAYFPSYPEAPTVDYWEHTETGFERPRFQIEAVNRNFFDWAKVDEEFRGRLVEKYASYMPGFPLSEDPIDLHRFFGCEEFQAHMNGFPRFEDGDTFNPNTNGIILAGWTVLRDYLIECEPELMATLTSLLWLDGAKSLGEHDEPADFLQHVSTSKITNRIAPYALWMLQKDDVSMRILF